MDGIVLYNHPTLMVDAGAGLYGSVMSIIWTPLSQTDATRAYVDELIVTVNVYCTI